MMTKLRTTLCLATLLVAGCTALPLVPQAQVSGADCTQSCEAHFEQCPRVFAAFPERGAIECPAARRDCLASCAAGNRAGRAAQLPTTTTTPTTTPAPSPVAAPAAPTVAPLPAASPSREEELRELKRLHDLGLVTDQVYTERQLQILARPQAVR